MNKQLVTRAAAASAALAASAIGAQAQDIDGFYAGIGLVPNDALTADTNWGDNYASNASVASLFAGYNRNMGNWVLGGEVAGFGDADIIGPFLPQTITGLVDLKARVGKAFGPALVYGSLGYSTGEFSNNQIAGMNYGVGFEYGFGTNMFGGLDYTQRDMDFDTFSGSVNVSTTALRFGWRF